MLTGLRAHGGPARGRQSYVPLRNGHLKRREHTDGTDGAGDWRLSPVLKDRLDSWYREVAVMFGGRVDSVPKRTSEAEKRRRTLKRTAAKVVSIKLDEEEEMARTGKYGGGEAEMGGVVNSGEGGSTKNLRKKKIELGTRAGSKKAANRNRSVEERSREGKRSRSKCLLDKKIGVRTLLTVLLKNSKIDVRFLDEIEHYAE